VLADRLDGRVAAPDHAQVGPLAERRGDGVVAAVGDHALGAGDHRVGVGKHLVERGEDRVGGGRRALRDADDVVVAGEGRERPRVDEDRVDVGRRDVEDVAAREDQSVGPLQVLDRAVELGRPQEEAERAQLGVAPGDRGHEQLAGELAEEVDDAGVADGEPVAGGGGEVALDAEAVLDHAASL
jgi:hypothetical protein